MYKLIACDLDETLLGEDKGVSLANRQAIEKARAKGVKFVPTTGRGYTTVQKTLQEIGTYDLPNDYVISFNGGMITENRDNKPLFCSGLSFEQAKAVFEVGVKSGVFMHVYASDNGYMYNLPEEEKAFLDGRVDGYEVLQTASIDFLKEKSLIKVLFGSLYFSQLQEIEKNLPESIKLQYSISFSSNRYLEFNQINVNKGEGILRLAQMLDIKLDEVIAIGDNNNDIAMLQKAGLGVAVQNATDEAKKCVDYICEANHDQSAIAEVINKFILLS